MSSYSNKAKKTYDNSDDDSRGKDIIKASVVGILVNLALSVTKMIVGSFSHSIAIILDGVNNMSDMLSSAITIVGIAVAGKEPDREHPMGHGRIEYLSALMISTIIICAGVMALFESVKKIMKPVVPKYSVAGLSVIGATIVVKIVLGLYVRKTGKRLNSASLIGSGTDAMFDAVIASATMAAGILFLVRGLRIEAWLGSIIAIFIMRVGYRMMRETVSEILGERVDSSLSHKIKNAVYCFPGVIEVSDLILHSYGPDNLIGSVSISVPEDYTASRIDGLTRSIRHEIFGRFGVMLSGVSIYAVNMSDEEMIKTREEITKIVMNHDYVVQMHGFYADTKNKRIYFDLVVDFDAPDRKAVFDHVEKEIKQDYPGYKVIMDRDIDVSD